jgi:hypothetical protein
VAENRLATQRWGVRAVLDHIRMLRMKRMITLTAMTVAMISLTTSTNLQAAEPIATPVTVSQGQEKPGVFARLWELEKRKNAWILRKLGLKR